MADASGKLGQLAEMLNRLPTGPINQTIVDDVTELLGACWDLFDGSAQAGMEGHKVDRAEELRWNKEAQTLTFIIERHGAIVRGGSSKAELQGWTINLKNSSAVYGSVGSRRARGSEPPSRVDINAIVSEIVQAIKAEEPLEGVTRQGSDVVGISPGHFVPDNGLAAQTLQSRRKRFRSALESALKDLGWARDPKVKPHTFRRVS